MASPLGSDLSQWSVVDDGGFALQTGREEEAREDAVAREGSAADRYPPSSPPSTAQLSKVVSFSDVTDTPYDDDYGDEARDDEDEDTTPRHRPSHRHRHSTATTSPGSHGSGSGHGVRRRSSVKSSSDGGAGGQCAKRRTSVPANMMRPHVAPGESHTLGRRSPRNPQFVHQDELWLSQRPSRGASPSGSATPPNAGPPHGAAHGPAHGRISPHASSPYLLNGDESERERERQSLHYLSNNSSTPSVPAAVMSERSDRSYGEPAPHAPRPPPRAPRPAHTWRSTQRQ